MLATALAVLVLNVVVQQSTKLHPLIVFVSITTGALTLGTLGAFIAVPHGQRRARRRLPAGGALRGSTPAASRDGAAATGAAG